MLIFYIFLEREYQCLGQWEENKQLLAYVRRKDLNSLECFVGATDENGQIFLIESGHNCQRNLRVFQSGMKLTKSRMYLLKINFKILKIILSYGLLYQ